MGELQNYENIGDLFADHQQAIVMIHHKTYNGNKCSYKQIY